MIQTHPVVKAEVRGIFYNPCTIDSFEQPIAAKQMIKFGGGIFDKNHFVYTAHMYIWIEVAGSIYKAHPTPKH